MCRMGQDGRAIYGAAFRSQSGSPGVGSNPTSDNSFNKQRNRLLIFIIKRGVRQVRRANVDPNALLQIRR